MPGLRVFELPPPARRELPAEGRSVRWSAWLNTRFDAGEIALTDPRPTPSQPSITAGGDGPSSKE